MTIKIDLKELARQLVDEFSFEFKNGLIETGQFDEYNYFIEDYISDLLDDNQRIEEVELQALFVDLNPFICMEILNRVKLVFETMENEDRKVLVDNIKEYDTYIEED